MLAVADCRDVDRVAGTALAHRRDEVPQVGDGVVADGRDDVARGDPGLERGAEAGDRLDLDPAAGAVEDGDAPDAQPSVDRLATRVELVGDAAGKVDRDGQTARLRGSGCR